MSEHWDSSDTETEEDVSTVDELTFESLIQENKQLKVKLKELRKSLALKDRKLKDSDRTVRIVDDMFTPQEWEYIIKLRGEERELEATMKELVLYLGKLNRDMWGKEQEIRGLTKKLLKLKNGSMVPACQPQKIPKDSHNEKHSKITDAIELLREEMWRMIILGHLTDANDLLSCCNTCKLFKEILHRWESGQRLEQSLPYFYMNLTGHEMLGLRTICKDWKDGLDRFFQSHPSLLPTDGGKVSNPRRLDFVNPMKEKGLGNFIFSFHGPEYDDNFEDPDLDFQNMDRWNPFIGRSANLSIGGKWSYFRVNAVIVDEGDELYPEEFGWYLDFLWNENEHEGETDLWGKLYKFLDSCGREIWHLTIGFGYNDHPYDNRKCVQRNVVRFLTTDMFQFLPNLRTLSFSSIEYNKHDIVINPNSLPEAPHLESLHVGCIGIEEPFLLSLLQRYHGQIRKLHLTAEAWEKVSDLNWSNLAELHVDYAGSEIGSVLPRALPRLTRFRMDLDWLYANFSESCFPRKSFSIFSNAIQQLCEGCPLLNTIRIKGGLSVQNMAFLKADGKYAPPQIKTLEIDSMGDNTTAMTFILRYFPFLENLNLFSRENRKDQEFENLIALCSKSEYQLGVVAQSEGIHLPVGCVYKGRV